MWLTAAPGLFHGMAYFVLGLTGLLVYAMLHILVRKYTTTIQEKRTAAKRTAHRELLSNIAHGEVVEGLELLSSDEKLDLRNIICDMASDLKGISFDRIQKLYADLGFEVEDVLQLTGRNIEKKLRALHRLEKLKVDISLTLHHKLLVDKHPIVRLLAMLLYIHNYKKAATPKLISFIEQKRYGKRGYLFYILQEIGRYDRDALSFLFERIYDPEFEEAILISASISPPLKFDEIIYRKLNRQASPFVIVWALRVLGNYPSMRLYALINVLRTHFFWAIRLEVVKILDHFEPRSVSKFLDDFLRDGNYLVRAEAAQYAMKHPEDHEEIIRSIIQNPEHPARSVMLYYISLNEVKEAA